MACGSCASKVIQPETLQNINEDKILDLYRSGYHLSNSSNIKAMGFSDVGTFQWMFLGIWSYASYKSYTTKHNIWAIIFGALALGTAGGVYSNLNK